MKKLIFGITSLSIGGAERVLVDIANKLQSKYDITIFTLYGNGEFEKELNKNIKIINYYKGSYESLPKYKKRLFPLYILKCGKQIYKKYIEGNFDVQIAFLEGPITRIFQNGTKTKKIVWIHNDISKVFGSDNKAKLKLKIDKKSYSKYDKIVFVSNHNKEDFNSFYKDDSFIEKEEVVYNYIDKDRIIKLSNVEIGQNEINSETPSIITVSRLVKQKALERLINVHKRLIEEKINHKMYIIGDGPEKENLKKLIKDKKVEETFILIGKKENPYPYMKKADYIALLSYFEGYPMCLEEAKVLGKKIIITDTASKEVVSNYNKKIILDNNEQSIYEGLKHILKQNMFLEKDIQVYENEYLLSEIERIIEFK